MVVVVFTVGEMNDMLTVVLSRRPDLVVVASWSGVADRMGEECNFTLYARKSSASSKWISNIWTICSDTTFSESIAHSMNTYTVVMSSWHRYGSLQCWQAVLITDESRFNLFRADGRRRVYRRRNGRYADCCVMDLAVVASWSGVV
jgi:hypothetical protein